MNPFRCCYCGRFIGKDGLVDIGYDHYSGCYEEGYSKCGRCIKDDAMLKERDEKHE